MKVQLKSSEVQLEARSEFQYFPVLHSQYLVGYISSCYKHGRIRSFRVGRPIAQLASALRYTRELLAQFSHLKRTHRCALSARQ